MTKGLVTFTVCSLYLIHFVSDEKHYSKSSIRRQSFTRGLWEISRRLVGFQLVQIYPVPSEALPATALHVSLNPPHLEG